jgi:thermostable 8-oxoguanine DNA glycosylase
MLVIDRKFVLEWAYSYDMQFNMGHAKREEDAVRRWLSTIPEPKYLNKEMFVCLCCWKSARPRKHYEANTEETIEKVTSQAYQMRNALDKLKLLDAKLKGVGVAVAACILHYLQPDEYPIFDYHATNTLREAGLWTREKGGASSGNKAWLDYVGLMRNLSRELSVTLRELDKALFAYDKKYPLWKHCPSKGKIA